ncbi:MAG: substrate-binding domain-containing protein [Proteobacteria bacterium]|nr:substrate-binding domain-containing protein [Pseudomonadota bacterium]MDE3207813.1 substrate-binding domain-containing protein [Pseudomonadota bacterium]
MWLDFGTIGLHYFVGGYYVSFFMVARMKNAWIMLGMAVVFLGFYAMPSCWADSGVIQQKLQIIPGNSDDNMLVLAADGTVIRGDDALDLMQAGRTSLNIWLGGEHFYAAKALIRAWQNRYGGTVGLIELKPYQVVAGVVDGGWIYRGISFSMRPDILGLPDKKTIRKLKEAGLVARQVVYAHDELALLVARGNPRHIHRIEDLVHPNLRVWLPNPVNEPIMKKYARRMLGRFDLWRRLSGGAYCVACQGAKDVYFTSNSAQDIPEGIRSGHADVGLLWLTECQNALDKGFKVSLVRLPASQSLKGERSYVAATGSSDRHPVAAREFLDFLGSRQAQAILVQYGYVGANRWERRVSLIR